MEGEMEYMCPECGAPLPPGARFCTTCDAEFEWEEDADPIDKLLGEIADPGEAGWGEDEESPEEEAVAGEGLLEEIPPEEIPPGQVPPEEIPTEETPPEEAPPATPRRLYGGVLSVLGLALAALTVAALVATVLALRWDTWVGGAAEESIGDYQVRYVYLGATGTVACAVLTVVDVLRNRRRG